eukprot:Rmarinus@m.25986
MLGDRRYKTGYLMLSLGRDNIERAPIAKVTIPKRPQSSTAATRNSPKYASPKRPQSSPAGRSVPRSRPPTAPSRLLSAGVSEAPSYATIGSLSEIQSENSFRTVAPEMSFMSVQSSAAGAPLSTEAKPRKKRVGEVIFKYKQEIARLTRQLDDAKSQVSTMKRRVSEMEDEVTTVRIEKLSALETAAAEKETAVRELKRDIKQEKLARGHLKSQVEEAKSLLLRREGYVYEDMIKAYKDLETRHREVADALHIKRRECVTLRDENIVLRGLANQAQAELHDLRLQYEGGNRETLQAIGKRAADAEGREVMLQRVVQEKEEELDRMRLSVQKSVKLASVSQQEVSSCKQEIRGLRLRLKHLEEQYEKDTGHPPAGRKLSANETDRNWSRIRTATSMSNMLRRPRGSTPDLNKLKTPDDPEARKRASSLNTSPTSLAPPGTLHSKNDSQGDNCRGNSHSISGHTESSPGVSVDTNASYEEVKCAAIEVSAPLPEDSEPFSPSAERTNPSDSSESDGLLSE